jgi:hypothetical protein
MIHYIFSQVHYMLAALKKLISASGQIIKVENNQNTTVHIINNKK